MPVTQLSPTVTHLQPPSLPGYTSSISVFIAGGIGGCPDWQGDFARMFASQYKGRTLVTLVNPRRPADFERTGPAAQEQIEWEHAMLEACPLCVFWFPSQGLCPIALFELGVQITRPKIPGQTLFCGWHPEYPRAFDLQIQLALAKPGPTYSTLPDLVAALVARLEQEQARL